MLGHKSLVLFDLDGTLVDSVPDIADATNATLAALERPVVKEHEVRNWVGNGVDKLLHRALTRHLDGKAEQGLHRAAQVEFSTHYARLNGERARLYDGVTACLEALGTAGHELACVTNKPLRFANDLLAAMDIDSAFALVLGGDSLTASKPDPLPLLHAAAHFAISIDEMVMVGDSINDVRAARAARCAIVCVSYGYNHGVDIRESQPDAVVDSLAELPALLTPSVPATCPSSELEAKQHS